jgi:hypothetical protein
MPEYKDGQGRYITRGLFLETITPGFDFDPPFTLKNYDHLGKASMKKVYMSYNDPTEYQFAIDVLGSWEHWEKLCNTEWFRPIVEEWRTEMETKVRSLGVSQMAMLALEGKESAAKWLAEGGWSKKRGRPSKAEIEGEKKKAARVRDNLHEDMARLGLKLHENKQS